MVFRERGTDPPNLWQNLGTSDLVVSGRGAPDLSLTSRDDAGVSLSYQLLAHFSLSGERYCCLFDAIAPDGGRAFSRSPECAETGSSILACSIGKVVAHFSNIVWLILLTHPRKKRGCLLTIEQISLTTAGLSHHSYVKYIVLPVFNLLRAHCRDITSLDRQRLHGSQPRVSLCVSKSAHFQRSRYERQDRYL